MVSGILLILLATLLFPNCTSDGLAVDTDAAPRASNDAKPVVILGSLDAAPSKTDAQLKLCLDLFSSYLEEVYVPCCSNYDMNCADKPDGWPGINCIDDSNQYCSCGCWSGKRSCGC